MPDQSSELWSEFRAMFSGHITLLVIDGAIEKIDVESCPDMSTLEPEVLATLAICALTEFTATMAITHLLSEPLALSVEGSRQPVPQIFIEAFSDDELI